MGVVLMAEARCDEGNCGKTEVITVRITDFTARIESGGHIEIDIQTCPVGWGYRNCQLFCPEHCEKRKR
jgi:hypothetical protein